MQMLFSYLFGLPPLFEEKTVGKDRSLRNNGK